ncbi:hypothetical protein M9Y10_017498 [Tritrichomonas musculus]|uniref:Importin N-terminal domain-containing protein n=1 Tax=Tritrichomonas musculus TaxID=1915356 RepID=A0ABR2HTR1_9EUKA
MDNEVENYILLLQNLNNPQDQNFERANKIISELIMKEDLNFLSAILNILLNLDLETNESFYALSIAKEYFKKSIVYDKFHDPFPKSSFTKDQIILFQKAAYRFFSSKKSFIRNNAADLYVQAFRTIFFYETDLIPQLIEKLANNSTQFEETLTIMECFCLIFSELEMCENEQKIFQILLQLLNQFSEKSEYVSIFFRLLTKFDHPIFQLLSEESTSSVKSIIVHFYREKVQLKTDIIKFLQSPFLDINNYCQIVDQLLPLFYDDLLHVESLPSQVELSILNFISTDLLNKYPQTINFFLTQLLPVILNISKLFSLEDDPRYFVPDEWETFNAAQDIIISLLFHQTDQKFKTIIFLSILPFIQNGLLNEDLHFRCVSMNLLSYSLSSVPPEIINQSISIDIVYQSLNQTINNNSCRVRFYWMQLLLNAFLFYGLDIALQFIDFLFKSIFDCEPISINAITILVYIGKDEHFTLQDLFFSNISEILCGNECQQLFNQSSAISNLVNALIFPQKHKEYAEPVAQFIITYLNKSLTFPEEISRNINRGVLHGLCSVLFVLISQYFLEFKKEDIKKLSDLSISLYNRFSLGSELASISPLIIKFPDLFSSQLKIYIDLVLSGFSNIESIYSFPRFITFSLFLAVHFDLSQFNLNMIVNYIQLFNTSQNFDIKKEVLSALVAALDLKPNMFSNDIIVNAEDFYQDLTENVPIIFSTFNEDSIPYYMNVARLFKWLIVKTEFRKLPKSFLFVNQLIVNILDFDDLAFSIFKQLKLLYVAFHNAYEIQLNELMNSQQVYKEKYMYLDQMIVEASKQNQKKS